MSTVAIELHELVELLIRSNETDSARWPAAAQEGAEMLRRIREIEAQCIAAHGEFDWETLDEDTQDEYDGLCGELNLWRTRLDPKGRLAPIDEVMARLGFEN